MNLLLNPSFEVDSNGDGLADNWNVAGDIATPATNSLVAGRYGALAQRRQYTSAGDTGKFSQIHSDMTAVGSFAAGGAAAAAIDIKGTMGSGVTLRVGIQAMNAAGTFIAVQYNELRVISAEWARTYAIYPSLPANTSRCRVALYVVSIDTGDAFDISFDGATLVAGTVPREFQRFPVIGSPIVRSAQ